MRSQRGFTLIEMMIVMAVIGVLAVLAIPAYQNYTIRAQVAEGLNLADGWKTSVAEYYTNYGTWPSQSDLTGTVPSVGLYTSGITVTSGVIQITYGGNQANQAISGAVLTLVPYTNDNGDVLWQCGLAAQPPSSVIASGAAPGGTTLAPQQLPVACNT